MQYTVWLLLNGLFVIVSAGYIWLFRSHDSTSVLLGQFLAQAAVWLFLININMYFIFLVIRKSQNRDIRIRLAKLSRRLMKVHVPLAVTGTALIMLHAGIMLTKAGHVIGFSHPKMISGYLAILLLIFTLIGGLMRRKRASGFRRKFHWGMAMVFGAAFVIHLFMPL